MEFKLSKEELDFCRNMAIEQHEIFDAKGDMKYKALMKGTEFIVAANVSPCQAFGHRLRTRSGHCAICNPANLNYKKRFKEKAFVYIAKPKGTDNLFKVGLTTNLRQRESTLNVDEYAGHKGWKIIKSGMFENGARVEFNIQKSLKLKQLTLSYTKGGKDIVANEVFQCSRGEVFKAFEEAFLQNSEFISSEVKNEVNSKTTESYSPIPTQIKKTEWVKPRPKEKKKKRKTAKPNQRNQRKPSNINLKSDVINSNNFQSEPETNVFQQGAVRPNKESKFPFDKIKESKPPLESSPKSVKKSDNESFGCLFWIGFFVFIGLFRALTNI